MGSGISNVVVSDPDSSLRSRDTAHAQFSDRVYIPAKVNEERFCVFLDNR